MNHSTMLKHARLFAGVAPIALLAMPAFAQDVPVAQEEPIAEEASGQDIIVTGSRIVRPNLESPSPVAVVTGEQTVANADITLDTYLNTLPQVNPAGTSSSNNPGNGGRSNIDLRGLGSNRNLVLINGRRAMVSDSDQTVDLNTIPQSLIQRVDVLTGGAGATYGADAIAGVVNVILKRDFEGIELRATYSNSVPETDARDYALSATLGGNFADGRGNIAVSFDYAERQDLIKAQRAFASQATSTTGTPPTGRLIEVNGIPQGAIDALFASYGVAAGQRPIAGLSQLHFNSDGSVFGAGIFNNPLNVSNYRYDPAGGDGAAANQNFFPDFYSYNFDAINYLQLPLERKSAFLTGRYEIIPEVEFFTQAGYTEYSSLTALAPTPVGVRIYATSTPGGTQFATSPFITPGAANFITNNVIPVTNPFISPDLAALLAARTGDDPLLTGSGATEPFRFAIRTLGTGLRASSYENEVIQVLGGLRGEVMPGWRYEAFYSWGRTRIDQAASGNVNVQQLQRLLEAPDGGASLCAGGYNPFGIQPLSPECVTFLDETGFTSTEFTQKIAQGYVSGEVVELPGGAATVVLGVEKRDFRYSFDPGALFGPIAGFNTAVPDLGTNSFLDFFGEVLLPVTDGIDISAGYRRSTSDFNDLQNDVDGDSKTSDAYKIDASWQVIEPVRLRASYQRSVRAPNFGELFSGGASFVSAFDPCTVSTNFRESGGTAARDLCIRNGVGGGTLTGAITAAQIAAAGSFVATPGLQVNTNFAGNTNLLPEKGTTITGGVVFEALGFTGSIDYYNIKVEDKIFGPDTNLIIAACYGYQGDFNSALAPDSPYCTSVRRSGSNLSSIFVATGIGGNAQGFFQSVNRGSVQTSGIDVQLAYRLPTDFVGEGTTLNFNLFANYLLEYKNEELPGVVLDYAGTAGYFGQGISAGGGATFPRFKATGDIAWVLAPITLSSRIRYISAMENRASVQFPGEEFTGPGEVFYFDFAGQIDIGAMQFRLGVNNAFNRQPPQYAPNVQSGTDPSTYDVIGRRGYVSARLRF